jgi:hypothetical protein
MGHDEGIGIAHSQTRAFLTLLAYALILVAIAAAIFRRRDVT